MGGISNDSSMSSPLSSPSSIVYVDLYGRRRQVAKVQVLEREIALLQEEIKSLAELEVASRCCKELDEYIEATPDPLIALNQIHGGSRSFWKNLRRKVGSVLCCCGCCLPSHCGCCCCWETCTSRHCKCPEISCDCSCPKPSVCCCCKPCLCF